ncbi:MAG: hypothetical protein NTW19_19525 [Planctomycetota bacterium]|nr:hypothetical protein [Planctomycetota bacterium]
MSGYTLVWKHRPGPACVDGSFLRPDVLGPLDPAALAAKPVPVGRDLVPLAELCDIRGQPGPTLTLEGAPPLDRLGEGMLSGELVIHGEAGDDLGASMRGGRIHVRGQAGRRVGGPSPTSRQGMSGGEIVIDGDAGDYAGLRMRRGLVAIRGRAGASPGYRMLAGTIIVGRGPMDAPGLEMRRGMILGLDRTAGEAPMGGHLVDVGPFASSVSPVLRLILRRVATLGWPVDHAAMDGRYRLLRSDALELGRGEVWQWLS